ncbi:MAG: porin [Bacterioplanes sp.]|nr:porin [Bacterioplanes sp.]
MLPVHKNYLSAIIAASVLAIGNAHASEAETSTPLFYGNLNLSLDLVDAEKAKSVGSYGDADHVKISSNNSRLGFSHTLPLDAGLTALIKAEVRLKADDGKDGGNSPFTAREIYVGVKGDFGQLIAGRINRPVRAVQGRLDVFNHLYGDINTVIGGEGFSDNVVQYSTPKLGHLLAKFAYHAAESENQDKQPTDLKDGYSASLTYDNNRLYAALGYEVDVKNPGAGIETTNAQNVDAARLGIGYKVGSASVGTILQYQKGTAVTGSGTPVQYNSVDNEEFGYVINGSYQLDRLKIKAQYGSVKGQRTDYQRDLWVAGADYSLSNKSHLFVAYTHINKDEINTEKTDNVLQIGFNQSF